MINPSRSRTGYVDVPSQNLGPTTMKVIGDCFAEERNPIEKENDDNAEEKQMQQNPRRTSDAPNRNGNSSSHSESRFLIPLFPNP